TIAVLGEPGHRVQCVRALELPHWQRPQAAAAVAAADEREADLVLDIDGLRKFYETSTSIFSGAESYQIKALNDVSMSARRGMTLAIVGESGCGKSTLAKVLTGLEKATDGKVALDGSDIGGIRVEDRTSAVKGKL